MDPDVLNISVDDNEADTSHDELDEDPDYRNLFSSPVMKKYIGREQICSSGEFAELFKDWERAPVLNGSLLYSSSCTEAQPDSFQFLVLDSVSSISAVKHPDIELDEKIRELNWHTVMRLFGVARIPVYSASEDLFEDPDLMNPKSFDAKNCASVCVNVHGFVPYFYAVPRKQYFQNEEGYMEFLEMQTSLEDFLNKKVSDAILSDLTLVHVHDLIIQGHSPVVSIEGVPLKEVQNSIFEFPTFRERARDSAVLKVYVALPMFITITAKVLDAVEEPCGFNTFETNLNNNIRFLTDRNIPGCTWLKLKGGKYFHRDSSSCEAFKMELESHCQIELDVHFKNIDTIKDQPLEIPPLRILSFDLECRLKEVKNVASQVIQLGAVLSCYGPDCDTDPVIGKAIFVLGTCASLPDARVIQFYDKDNPNNNSEENLRESEAVMLASFRDFVIQMDPDIITGYNIKNFDFPYLFDRVDSFYHTFEDVKRFPFLGRLRKVKASIRAVTNPNKRMYRYDNTIVNVQGRIIMDMYPLFCRHSVSKHHLKLKQVAKKYLQAGEEKDDVKYTEINGLQDGDALTRKRLAHYCVQDSFLPVKLMLVLMPDRKAAKQNFIEHYFENSRNGGTIIRYLVNKSKEYNKYFKQVRVQKNNGKVEYYPDTPSPKKLPSSFTKPDQAPLLTNAKTAKQKKASRMLFTDEDD